MLLPSIVSSACARLRECDTPVVVKLRIFLLIQGALEKEALEPMGFQKSRAHETLRVRYDLQHVCLNRNTA